jgi:hypothetical protein
MRPVALLAASCLLLAGCADILKSSRVNPQTIAVYPDAAGERWPGASSTLPCPLVGAIGDSNPGAVNLDCFQFPEDRRSAAENAADGTGVVMAATKAAEAALRQPVRAYDRAAGGPDADLARNRLAAILLKQADDVCTVEKGRLVRSETVVNFSLSFLTTALSAAATIVTGERAKSVLAGFATGSSATQDNVNATFYKNQLVQAIGKVMDAERERRLQIITGQLTLDVAHYPVDEVIRQVNGYHQACSFERGLQLLLDAAVDARGASAMLQTQANQAAAAVIKAQIAFVEARIADPAFQKSDDALRAQWEDLVARLNALAVADSAARSIRANAADGLTPVPAASGAAPAN